MTNCYASSIINLCDTYENISFIFWYTSSLYLRKKTKKMRYEGLKSADALCRSYAILTTM